MNQPDKDPGPIGTEEVAHVPEWLEFMYWATWTAAIGTLIIYAVTR